MKRLKIIIGAASFASLIYIFGWSSLFTVSSVEVIGAPTPEASQEVSARAAIMVGGKLARVDSRAISMKLSSLKWIKSSDISRNWISHKVSISVQPRTPLAQLNNLYLDGDGVTFTVPGQLPLAVRKDLPHVTASTEKAAISAAHLFTTLPTDIRLSISSMSASSSSISFRFLRSIGTPENSTILVRWGSDSDNELKSRVLRSLLALPENKKISRMDLSAPHAPIVK